VNLIDFSHFDSQSEESDNRAGRNLLSRSEPRPLVHAHPSRPSVTIPQSAFRRNSASPISSGSDLSPNSENADAHLPRSRSNRVDTSHSRSFEAQ